MSTRAKSENEGGMRERKRNSIPSFHHPQPPIWKWETLACVAGDLFGEKEKQGVKRARTSSDRCFRSILLALEFFFFPSAINAGKALFNLTCYHPSGQGASPVLWTRWWVILGAVPPQQLGGRGVGEQRKDLNARLTQRRRTPRLLIFKEKRKNSSESGWTRKKKTTKTVDEDPTGCSVNDL